MVRLWLGAGQKMVSCGQVACKGSVRPSTGEVIIVVVRSSWAVRSTAIVEAAKDVETLAVDIEVEDHHDEEVHQAEQQHSLADPLQGPAQHQPAHGQSHTARSATRIRSTSPLRAAEPSWTQFTKIHLQNKREGSYIALMSIYDLTVGWDQTLMLISLNPKHNYFG